MAIPDFGLVFRNPQSAICNPQSDGWAVEVRKREATFGLPDVAKFRGALESVQREKRLDRVVGWVFSAGGFTGEATRELKAAGVLYSTTAELQDLLDEFHLRGG